MRAAALICLVSFLAPVARAGDSTLIAPGVTASIVGASPDGSAYVLAFVGRNELEEERGVCAYPAWPGVAPAGVDDLVVEIRQVRQKAATLRLLDWAVDPQQDRLDKARCTPAAQLATRREQLDGMLKALGIVLREAPLPPLAVTATGEIVIPAAAMRAVHVDADVFLKVSTRADGRAWISARADGFGDEKVQQVEAGLMVDGATATLLPGQPFVVVVPHNGRGWTFPTAEVPLARLAVRLLTARGEKTGSVKDLDLALQLDPSFERAKKARARLPGG